MESEPLQCPDIEGVLNKYLVGFFFSVVGWVCFVWFFCLQAYLGVCMIIQQQ